MRARHFFKIYHLAWRYNQNEAVLKESQNNFDRPVEHGISKISIFLNQTLLVMSEYKILQILSVFRGQNTMTFTLQSTFYKWACALTVYIPTTSRQILQGNSWTESPGLKNMCAFCSRMPIHRGSTVGFLLLQSSSGVVRHPRDLQVSVTTHCFCRFLNFISS